MESSPAMRINCLLRLAYSFCLIMVHRTCQLVHRLVHSKSGKPGADIYAPQQGEYYHSMSPCYRNQGSVTGHSCIFQFSV